MGVWCIQAREDGHVDEPLAVSPNHPGVPDAQLLAIKAESAAANGWDVRWHGSDRFTATKRRWAEHVKVTRTFWSEA